MNIRSLDQAISDWKNGKTVCSVSLGGIGPSYEQAIQILLWEILSRWKGGKLKNKTAKYPKAYELHVDKIADELNEKLGFSGAQVGAAKATAYQFLRYGYLEMMEKAVEQHREIFVSKKFPSWESP